MAPEKPESQFSALHCLIQSLRSLGLRNGAVGSNIITISWLEPIISNACYTADSDFALSPEISSGRFIVFAPYSLHIFNISSESELI